jgi:hypothetical protein
LFYNSNGLLLTDVCLSVRLDDTPLDDDEKIVVTYGNQTFVYGENCFSVEDHLYTLKISHLLIDPENSTISVSTSSNSTTVIDLDLGLNIHDYVDYSPIINNGVLNINILNPLSE